jgi:hypothetical protein
LSPDLSFDSALEIDFYSLVIAATTFALSDC